MRYTFLILLFSLVTISGLAQEIKRQDIGNQNDVNRPNNDDGDSQQTVVDNRPPPPIEDYKILADDGTITHVDTTLSIQKDYQYNYLRKDNFGLLPFSNVGQTYTSLTQNFDDVGVMPEFGAKAAHFAYYDVNDIYYYNVPTPWTELLFKTTFEQGQLLDAFFTTNISPQINLSIAHKGLNSLGKYRNDKAKQSSLRTTFSYSSKNLRYQLHSHFVGQRLTAQQNGGLTDLAESQFSAQSAQFRDRAVLDVNFMDAERLLRAKRFFIKHHFNLIQGDSTANNQLQIGHRFNFTDKEYYYDQDSPFEGFGKSLKNSNLKDLTEFQDIANTVYAQYQNKYLGKLQFRVRHSNYNYGYKRKLYLDDGEIPNRLKGDILSLGASFKKEIAGFAVEADGMVNTVGDFDGNYLKAKAGYQMDSLNKVEAGVLTNTRRPDYNFLLFQSNYKNYNWHNNFKNEQKQRVHFKLQSPKYVNIEADYTRFHNYAYFGLKSNPEPNATADDLVTPYQYEGDISYARIKANREFTLSKFSLDNTALYQNVLDGSTVLHLPDFITRHSLYYSDYWFQRNLFVQTGLIYNYFTGYKADFYDPVLAEFYIQDHEKMKGFSRVDFFFNAKLKTARLFFKVENLTTIFDLNGHYAAPYQPYRDWNIRFGIVWDFFL